MVWGDIDDEGTWEADGVPVSAYGTAIIDVEVYADNTSSFAHKISGSRRWTAPSGGNSIGSHISNQPQPAAVKMASYFSHKSYAINGYQYCSRLHGLPNRSSACMVAGLLLGLSSIRTMIRSTGRRAWGEPNMITGTVTTTPVILTGGRSLARIRVCGECSWLVGLGECR